MPGVPAGKEANERVGELPGVVAGVFVYSEEIGEVRALQDAQENASENRVEDRSEGEDDVKQERDVAEECEGEGEYTTSGSSSATSESMSSAEVPAPARAHSLRAIQAGSHSGTIGTDTDEVADITIDMQ